MIRHLAVEAQTTKPAVRQVEVHLLAQPPLRADAEAVADDQHPDQQLRVDRRPPHLAVERSQFLLAGLTELRTLYLYGTHVSDLTALSGLTGLQTLDLGHTQVRD